VARAHERLAKFARTERPITARVRAAYQLDSGAAAFFVAAALAIIVVVFCSEAQR